ncbi:hypothetical protein OOZ19_29800 [Saccharopolyspora sp. NFXS83]|uniref:helix-turn-helix domain-containing protein n=1 Tax=Saccharopolyspora sp. NFXS83 TaxID=2993560 RepID=UPI00224B7D7E|nr:helix-turn-helix domain-containing protein [Saccharopolyspora sp. NFXS83]MCX2734460.1 hypothetical protein [Saccharopolyspora sp. NFXS83]
MSPPPIPPAEEPDSPEQLPPGPASNPDVSRWNDVEALRGESDPVLQAARATELINEYGRRVIELSALRRIAIERARRENGMTHGEVADSIGITRGRLSQIRSGHTR